MSVSTPKRFTGWHMLAILVTFFGVVVTVNITMAVLAHTSWTGLLAKNGYRASI
ncbi:MAG: FixH family protein, partial [Pseudomonadota bacterium]